MLNFKSSTCIFKPVSVQCLDMLEEWRLSGDRTQRNTSPSLLLSPLWAEPTQHLHKHSLVFSFFAKSPCKDSQAAYLVCGWCPVSLQKSDLSGTFFCVLKSRKHKKSGQGGTSLTVQCLRLHAFTAEGTGSIPGQATRMPHALGHDQKKKKE